MAAAQLKSQGRPVLTAMTAAVLTLAALTPADATDNTAFTVTCSDFLAQRGVGEALRWFALPPVCLPAP
jgi:hypothetical protein